MRTGASAYCAKDITPDEIVGIIRDVASGYYVVSVKNEWMNVIYKTGSATNVEAVTGPYAIDPEDHFIPLSPQEKWKSCSMWFGD